MIREKHLTCKATTIFRETNFVPSSYMYIVMCHTWKSLKLRNSAVSGRRRSIKWHKSSTKFCDAHEIIYDFISLFKFTLINNKCIKRAQLDKYKLTLFVLIFLHLVSNIRNFTFLRFCGKPQFFLMVAQIFYYIENAVCIHCLM